MSSYTDFIVRKTQWQSAGGFQCGQLPSFLYDFQAHLVEWALSLGRAAIFADCGMGKTAMQLAWASQVSERENRSVLIVTPLAVGTQTVAEADKFGVTAERSRNGQHTGSADIVVTNYEQLHKFNPSEFAGVVCDESSAIKDFKSERKAVVVEFMRTIKYRLLCTATAAPNDYWELGTSSEALGLLGFRDMITKFFKQETSKDHHGWGRTKYRFRGHAQEPFWSWVCSWAKSLQKPSDLGFDDTRFILPPLHERAYVVETTKCRPGMLFNMPAQDMREEREERRMTIDERCDKACEIASEHPLQTILWGQLNDECNELERRLTDAVQVRGSMSDEQKEEYLLGFANGQIRQLICKPKIGAWGLNFQRCHNVIVFPSHSFEQYYQSVRRCYRFGQQKPVTVSLVLSEGEQGIADNLARKKHQVSEMFRNIVKHMRDSMHVASADYFPESEEVPAWL